MKCLGLFYLYYKTEFAPQKQLLHPTYTKNPLSLQLK